jgi:hypothetical protein
VFSLKDDRGLLENVDSVLVQQVHADEHRRADRGVARI